jgi:hypothetical protein
MLCHSLVPIGQFCDAGCTAVFDKADIVITLHNTMLMPGKRHPVSRLWHLTILPPGLSPAIEPSPHIAARQHLPQTTTVAFANAAHLSASLAELVTFAHAALLSPSLSTLCTALDLKHVTGFPGLTSKLVRKYPPQSIATAMGHMDQSRKSQRLTKPKASPPPADQTATGTLFPKSPLSGKCTHHVYVAVSDPDQTGKIFSDQTGRFIIPSSTGSTQLFILYDYNSNHIFAEPMKNKTAASILNGYKVIIQKLQLAGCHPTLQRLDNECSTVLKEYMREQDITFQLVPPGTHRCNAAERAIRTFKNQSIAALCSLDKNFPVHLWDRLIPQAVLTLNLLRGSRINPKLSAWAQINGPYDYNATPIASPDIHVVAYEPPSQRG